MEPPNSLKGPSFIVGPNLTIKRLIPKLQSYSKDNWDFLKKLSIN